MEEIKFDRVLVQTEIDKELLMEIRRERARYEQESGERKTIRQVIEYIIMKHYGKANELH